MTVEFALYTKLKLKTPFYIQITMKVDGFPVILEWSARKYRLQASHNWTLRRTQAAAFKVQLMEFESWRLTVTENV